MNLAVVDYLNNSNWDPFKKENIPEQILEEKDTPEKLYCSNLIFTFKKNNKFIPINIVLNDTPFVSNWKQYLVQLSERLPMLEFSILPFSAQEVEIKDPIPSLKNLYKAFSYISNNIDINYTDVLGVIEHNIKNPAHLTQLDLNNWHRNFAWLVKTYQNKTIGNYEELFKNIHEINRNVHNLEDFIYYKNKDKIKTNIKQVGKLICTNADYPNHLEDLDRIFGHNQVGINDTFDPYTENYDYSVWLNEDIQGKDQIKSWAEDDDMTASDCTGNLFMTPNLILDPRKHYKTVLDSEDFKTAYQKTNKPLNRWPIGNLENEPNWAELNGAIIHKIELDDVVLWQKYI